MNWKKKLLALGLSLALTLSLTACGQKAAEPEQPEEPAQTEEPAAEAPDGTEADIAHFRIAALKGPTAMRRYRAFYSESKSLRRTSW